MTRLILFVAAFSISNHVFAEEDTCAVVLDRAAANISYRFGSATAASTQANALCDERYDKMSTTEQKGLEAQYDIFKASYSASGSSLKEYRSKYCSDGKSSFFSTSQSTEYSSQIYEASVAAWRDCKSMQAANVLISPVRAPNDRSVVLSISYRGPGTAKLTGIRISPKTSFTCTGDGGKVLSGPTDILLKGDSYSIDCTRIVKSGKGTDEFAADASSITVTTSATTRPFMLYFPAIASPDVAADNAIKLRTALTAAEAKISAMEKSIRQLDGVLGRTTEEARKIQEVKLAFDKFASNTTFFLVWKGGWNGTVNCNEFCSDTAGKWPVNGEVRHGDCLIADAMDAGQDRRHFLCNTQANKLLGYNPNGRCLCSYNKQ